MSSQRNLNDIPSEYHSIFSPIVQFNAVQTKVFNDVFETSKFYILKMVFLRFHYVIFL